MGVNFNYKSGQNIYAVFVNDVAPPGACHVRARARARRTVEATPGGKGFRIQVQYRVPSICKPTCAAHAEIRTRNGRQQYAVSATAPLPGDGKVVLGTRGSVKLPGGKKVRFYMTISKARAAEGAVHDGRRQPRREHAAARLADDEERAGADGARRADRRLDRAHQVGGASGSVGDPVAGRGGSTPDQ